MTRRLHARIAAAAVALSLAACATLPPGVAVAPADDPAAGVLTLPSGREIPVFPDSLSYSGKATLRWPDGRSYRGDWANGRPDGRGAETLPDGTTYRGAWRDGAREGQGELYLANGDHYSGDFAGGLRQGQGTLESADGEYRGQWVGDVPQGHGVFESGDGTYYEGEWRFGQRFGFGAYVAPDGSRYEGDWAYDQPDGFGHLEGAGGSTYQGEWQQGKRQGYGRAEGPPGLVYEGTWIDGRRQGYGREERPDGSTYRGEWHADKRQGQGREEHSDGWFHDGTWELNQALGPGLRRSANGIEISGLWNGDTVSTGLLRLPSSLEYAGPLYSRQNRVASAMLVRWLESAARDGDPYAQYLLGKTFLDFDEPAPDAATARRWLGAAAAAGIADAQFRLALTYEDVNPPRVVELLSEAAEQGHPGANQTLGEYYHTGITVPRNLNRAIRYYQRAVDGGSVVARNNLAWLLATADQPRVRDGERAVTLIRPIALYSGAWQYLDTLAAAWAAAGNFDDAVTTAEQALAVLGREAGAEGDAAPLEQRLDGYRQGRAYVEPAP